MEPTKEVVPVSKEKVEKQLKEFKPNPGFSTNLVPKGFREAMDMAIVLAKSNVVPKEMVGRPESCFVAIGFGMELGLPPLQAIQNIMVVGGRPTIWGDAALALVRSRKDAVRSIKEDPPDLALKQEFGRCEIVTADGEVVERRFSINDAKRARLWTKEGPWQTYPGRMLQMRARSWALRDAAPQVLKGIQIREEAEDYEIIHPPIQMPERTIKPSNVQDAEIQGNTPGIEPQTPPEEKLEASADAPPAQDQAPDPGMKISETRRKDLFKAWTKAKIKLNEVKSFVTEKFGIEGTADLTNSQADELEIWINERTLGQ